MSRKGENIYKRKDGRWEARYIMGYDENSKAKYKYIYAKTYTEVKKKLMAFQNNNMYKNTNSDPDKSKYRFWLDEWLKSKKYTVKESTYIRYKNIIDNHIKPDLGDISIDKINTVLITRFLSEKRQFGRLDKQGGLSEKSVSDILLVLKDTFKYIQQYGININCILDKFVVKISKKEMRVLSMDEEQRLINILFKNMDLYKLGVFICLYTGIRVGELCALKWKNIALDDKTIKIEKTLQRLQNSDNDSNTKTRIIITEPKSFFGKRIIPIPDFLVDIIKPFKREDDVYLLSGSHEIIEPRVMQNKFKKYLQEGKIKDANFHALRHTFATRCIEVGFDIKSLSEILGHSSVKITLDKYVHSSMEFKRNNMEKLKNITIH